MTIQGVVRAGKDVVDNRSPCKKRSTMSFVVMVVFVLLVSGCSQPLSTREKSTGVGALLGAGTGAIIGAAVGSPGAGAAIGGALGAGTGALYGDKVQGQETQQTQQQQQIQQNELELQRQRQELERLRQQQQRRYDDDY